MTSAAYPTVFLGVLWIGMEALPDSAGAEWMLAAALATGLTAVHVGSAAYIARRMGPRWPLPTLLHVGAAHLLPAILLAMGLWEPEWGCNWTVVTSHCGAVFTAPRILTATARTIAFAAAPALLALPVGYAARRWLGTIAPDPGLVLRFRPGRTR